MAAGLGFKNFATGDVLTAADTNGYLMQGVWVFASAAARDAAVTSPQEGNFAYLKDTNVTTYYTGSAWANLDTTGMTNPMTTTGDTIYSSSGSTPARLGIGTTGQVLTVSGGVPAWGNVSSVKPFMISKIAGRYVRAQATYSDNLTATEDVTYYIPIYLDGNAFDRISTRSAGNFAGSGVVRMGIYNANSTTGLPDTVYLDAGTINVTAANTELEITISVTPPAGYYYLAWNSQTAGSTNNFNGTTGYAYQYWIGTNTALTASDTRTQWFTQSGVTGAFATAGTLTAVNGSTQPLIAMRIA